MRSIRRLLLVALVGLVSLVVAVAAALAYHAGLREAGEMFDARLAHSARVLVSLVDAPLGDRALRGTPMTIKVWHADEEGAGLVSAGGHAYETRLAFQVRDVDGQQLLRSDSGPAAPLAPLSAGFVDIDHAGETWRVFTLRAPSGRWYQAGEQAGIREEIADEIALGTVMPLLVALPLLAVLVAWVVAAVSGGLRRVSAEIAARDPDRLAPIETRRVPEEVQPLVEAVNGLLARVQAGLARERRFTADAAHELRTPVAAVKVHADNLRTARDGEEMRESQGQLDAAIRRLERVARQLLVLSRLEGGATPPPAESLDLAGLVSVHLAEQVPIARARDQDLAADIAPAEVRGDAAALDALVRNLLDNALRYTPIGGRIRVTVAADGPGARLVVEDSGPGIPAEARARVFERFHRELGTGVEGSGLGLSIVAEAVARHGGRITLDASPSLGGLRVVVRLPRG